MLVLTFMVNISHAQTFLMVDGANWETCSGTFYDSGGAGGNYGNSESMTATLCPPGGAGSGPMSSIEFISWNVDLTGLLDNLVIHDGPTAASPVLATGSALSSLQGQSFMASGPSGCLTFVWTSDLLLTGGGWAATITTGPDAGGNGTTTVCANAAAFNLFTLLTGSPEAGGTWSFGGSPTSGTFTPGVSAAGVYTYTIAAVAPCVDASATVTVTVIAPPNAGSNSTRSVCSSAAPFDLFTALGGSPAGGGAWTGPGGTPVTSTFTPGTSPQGVYTYTVLGTPPCANATATVTVTVVAAPNPGTNASTSACSNSASFSLITRLGGTPQAGGTWVGPGGAHGPTFVPGTDVAGNYVYTVSGSAPCTAASATLSIAVQTAPNAGTNGSTTVCSTDANFLLFGLLGGIPDGGGTWTAPGGAAFPGTFIPGTSAAGVYTYTVAGTAPCANATSTVTVTVNTAPNAGTNATVSRCSNNAAFNLFAQLGGTPAPGGSWVGPSGASNGTFTPGTSTPGAYTYTVTGTAPCANATAVVTVNITQAPNAGTNGTRSTCATDAPFTLFNSLGGTPDAGGTWTAPGGGVSNGTFTPGTSAAGAYTYTVTGTAPCANATATVTVSVVAPPNPGTNGSTTVCSNGPAVNLFTLLGGSPAAGGTWTRPNGTAHTGSLDPATDPAGTYTYTVAGTAPCSAASSTVQVAKVTAPNAGTDGSITVCSTMAPFQLFTVLGGTPSGSGTWRTPTNAAFNGTFTPGTTAAGTYKYIVLGTTPCVNDTAFVTVIVNQAPNAGTNATVTVCSNQAAFTLISRLGGTPNAGGTWTGPDGLAFPGTYTPGTSVQGAYTYTVAGVSPCLAASAVVAITEQRQPVAGSNGSFSSCTTDGPVDLFDELGGTPDGGGVWTAPGGATVSGVFLPGTSVQGIYTYTLAATAPCTSASATVTATVNQAPDAGDDATVSICPDATPVNLFAALDGTPDAGGTWTDDDATGQLSAGVFTPTGLPAGDYDFTYTVTGNGQCGDAGATVRVTIVAALDAGTNGTLTVCSSNNLVDLFTGLGGTPQPGGAWSELSGTGALTGQFFNATLVPAGTYSFRYDLSGSASCMADNAQVNVTVVAQRRPGTNGSTTVCGNSGSFNLFPLLGGNPQPGGTWSPGTGQYDPSTNNPGVFTYTLTGTTPCPNATATVTVAEVAAPFAGNSASTTVCSNDGTFNMTLRLGGSPQPGSWSFGGNPHSNLFTPGVDLPGVYVYTVLGISPCGSAIATLTVNVNNAPNAGANADTTVCANGQSFSLLNLLSGGAQSGGVWTGPGGPHTGFYEPTSDEPGDYFYTVTGLSPCATDVAVVTVSESDVPNAGISAPLVVCSNGSSVNLITALGGTPSPTGSWTGPAPSTTAFNGVFIPGTTTPGTYTYTVQGTAPCPNATATVTVSLSTPPNAGTSRSIIACSSAAAFALVDSLGGTPMLNGTWTTPPPVGPTSGVFNPLISVPGIYTYTVPGTAPCANAVATVTVTVNQRANAGNDANLSVCSSGGAQDMFLLLGPQAQTGGVWTVQATGASHGSSFLPNSDVSGVYVYTVPGRPGCVSDQALVSVTLNQAPNAGFNGLITVCDDNTAFQLVNVLNGSPQLNGTWTDPTPAAHTGIFVPGTNQAGVYTYTVLGAAPCPNAQAQVTVFQNERPYAGENGVASVCSNNPPFSLFSRLTNNPDAGGSWTGPSGPVGNIFDPSTSQPGTYKYRIQGVVPCASDSATVTVFVNPAPNAGISTVAQICSSSAPVDLLSLLGGTPGTTGAWSFGGNPHGPQFDPLTDVSGAYVYTAVGTSPCVNAVSQVQITLVAAPSAGSDGSIAACIGDPAIQLASGLVGTWTAGGTWTDDDNTGALSGGILNGTSLAPGSYEFTYTVAGSGPCPTTTAVVTVAIAADLDAGDDISITVCENEVFDLFPRLGGTPQPGGFWIDRDGSGALIGGVFNGPQVPDNSTWNFDYVLPALGSCESDTATVTVQVQTGPFAGCDGFAGFCLNDPPDQLIGSLSCDPDGNGNWFNPIGAPHSGTFVPATDIEGVYRYVVPAIGSCPSDTAFVTVQVREPANAGQDAQVSICSTDAPVDLFTFLGPNAQTGGTWSRNDLPFSGIYNPAVDAPGQYRYRVNGQAPCSADFAFITVTEPLAAEAGTSASVDVCSDATPFNMRDLLGGLPQQGGAWSAPGGAAHGQTFDPAVDVEGDYRYLITGATPCANDTAYLSVNLFAAPNAGADATIEACATQTAVDLFAALGDGAQTGGVWTDIDVSGALTDSIFNPSLAGNGTWEFQYAILATAPCTNAVSFITVNVGSGASAGEDNTLTICGGETDYLLLNALAGDPDVGGTWTDLAGTGALLPGDTTIDASVLPVGGQSAFVYTVEDAGCGNVQATVLITTVAYPDPGTAAPLVVCTSDEPIDMFAQLGGTPQAGGIWEGPAGVFDGTFDPASGADGFYAYSIAGNDFCSDSSAVFQITVNDPPNAGANGQVLLCDTLTAYPLITGLNGTPDASGVWTDVNGAGGLTGAVLNTTGIEPGEHDFRYVVGAEGCADASSLLKVEVVSAPEVVDISTVCNEQDRTYVVTFTIQGGDQATYEVVGATGTLSESAPYIFTTDPVVVSQPFVAMVRDANACGEFRVETTSPCSFENEVFVPESFSPNGDGVNETFRIPGIEGFPNNTITIFNRWGAQVYDATGYDNNSVVWDGSSPDALLPGNAATGTYFYVLELGTSAEPLTGFIQLVR